MSSRITVGIIGGCGLLGRSLYRSVRCRTDHEAVVFDIRRHAAVEPSDFVRWDVTGQSTPTSELSGCEVVFYRAGLMGPDASFDRPERFYEVNTEGLINALRACARAGVRQFVYDSTESVFGPDQSAPFFENEPPRPASVYGSTKTASEEYVLYASRRTDMKGLVFRYPRVVAPDNRTVLGVIRNRLLEGEPVIVTAGGRKRFDLVHVDDVIRWNIWAIEHPHSGVLHVSGGFLVSPRTIATWLRDRGEPDVENISVRVRESPTANDRLLPDDALLDTEASETRTGLSVRATCLEDFASLL